MAQKIDIFSSILCVFLAGCMGSSANIYEFKEAGCEDFYKNISNTPEKDAMRDISQERIYYLSVMGIGVETPGINLNNDIETKIIPGTSDSECLFFRGLPRCMLTDTMNM